MITQSIAAVIDYLVSQSVARVGQIQSESSAVAEYAAIVDELDSLTSEEFSEVYAVYLIGSEQENDFAQARRIAAAANFLPLETMAQDINLHVVLTRGAEMHRRYVEKG